MRFRVLKTKWFQLFFTLWQVLEIPQGNQLKLGWPLMLSTCTSGWKRAVETAWSSSGVTLLALGQWNKSCQHFLSLAPLAAFPDVPTHHLYIFIYINTTEFLKVCLSLCRVATNSAVKLIEEGRLSRSGNKFMACNHEIMKLFHILFVFKNDTHTCTFMFLSYFENYSIPCFVGVIFDGVILEGTFNSDNNANLAKKESTAQQAIQIHPFSWVMFFFFNIYPKLSTATIIHNFSMFSCSIVSSITGNSQVLAPSFQSHGHTTQLSFLL